MKILYRIMGIITLVSILFVFFAIPASAASTITPDSIIDFLDSSTGYSRSTSSSSSSNVDLSLGSSYFTNITYCKFKWTNIQSFSGSIFISVHSDRIPDSLTLQRYDGAPWESLTFVGSSGKNHSYRLDFNSTTSFYAISLNASWNSSFTGNYKIVSFVGYSDPYLSINSFDYECDEVRWYSNGVNNVNYLVSGSASTPSTIVSHTADSSSYSIHAGIFKLIVDPSVTGYSVGSNLTVLFRHTGSLYDVGLSIVKNDDIVSVLDPLPYSTVVASGAYGFGLGTVVQHNFSLVSFDLEGYDFTDCDFYITGKVEAVPAGMSGNSAHYGWSLTVTGISLEPLIHEMAWYDTFYYKLNTIFSNWFNQDSTFHTRVLTRLISFNNLLSSISTKLDVNSNLMNDSSDFGSVVTQQKNDFNSANDSLNSVAKPDMSLIETDSSVIINPAGFNILSVPLKNIFQHNLILSILIIVATCALIGYVFFGKR